MSPRLRVLLIVGLFLALRLPLLAVREPFFDELLSVWYGAKPIAQHWGILAEDSGSPLYYGVARLAYVLGGVTVVALRFVSLLLAAVTLAAILFCRHLGESRFIAATLLAVFPAHVLFSTEARAYSLAALLVGGCVLALHRWMLSGSDGLLALGVLSLVLAAYTHSYGVLLFPLPLLLSLLPLTPDPSVRQGEGNGARVGKGLAVSAVAGVLFVPGFWLASVQPLESIAWMKTETLSARLRLVGGSLQQLGFAAPYPTVFSTPAPMALQVISLLLVLPLLVWGTWRGRDARPFALATLLPLLAVFAFAVTGRTFYFPMRFESVLSVPFVLWLALSLMAVPKQWRSIAVAAAAGLGIVVTASAILEHSTRQVDPYRQVAHFVRQAVNPHLPIVASGYSYLEVISQIDSGWRPRVIAYPGRQAVHPGWKESVTPQQLRREVAALPRSFLWVGSTPSTEARVISEQFSSREWFRDGPVVAAMVEQR